MNLDEYSDDNLIEEIERRKVKKIDKPQRRVATDTWVLNEIYETVERCLQWGIEKDYWDEDYDQYIFEATMKAFYGDDYFDWHNKRFP
jgi:hypothetical protein